jgi:hypothetical protein
MAVILTEPDLHRQHVLVAQGTWGCTLRKCCKEKMVVAGTEFDGVDQMGETHIGRSDAGGNNPMICHHWVGQSKPLMSNVSQLV